jgi:thiamine biosynthesis protein ThiS
VKLRINGEERDVVPGTGLEELVAALGMAPDRVAVECNRVLVRRTEYESLVLEENDEVEVVTLVGGG